MLINKPHRLLKLNQSGGMPKSMFMLLFVLFVVGIIGTFKTGNSHAYAVNPTSIKSGVSGDCLDVMHDDHMPGAIVDNYGCNGSDAQNWAVNTTAIKHAGLCLAVKNDSQKASTGIELDSCNSDSPGQVWLTYHGGLYNPNSKLCLSDPGSSSGNQLQLASCSSNSNELWSSPMLTLNCEEATGERAKVACYAEVDFETWNSGSVSHESLLNTYTDGSTYEEWCADFISYVYKQAGYPFTNAYAGWDDNNANNIQNDGFNMEQTDYSPLPGDIGYFNYNGGHVEIVISGGAHPTFIYGNSATTDPTTGNGEMESNTMLNDGSLGQLTYYLSPNSNS